MPKLPVISGDELHELLIAKNIGLSISLLRSNITDLSFAIIDINRAEAL